MTLPDSLEEVKLDAVPHLQKLSVPVTVKLIEVRDMYKSSRLQFFQEITLRRVKSSRVIY